MKFEDVSHEMLVLMFQHLSSRVTGFCDAIAVSMGEAAKSISVECFKTGCHVVLRGRRVALCDIPTCFMTCQKSFYVAGAAAVSMGEAAKSICVECFKTDCHVVLRGRRGTL